MVLLSMLKNQENVNKKNEHDHINISFYMTKSKIKTQPTIWEERTLQFTPQTKN